MHVPDEDAEDLREYIKKQLRDNSDADPEVLAEYVVALLQADDSPEPRKREECQEGLTEFLKGDVASKIVDDIFHAIHFKAYKPGYKPPPRQNVSSSLSASTAAFDPSFSISSRNNVGNGTNGSSKKNKRAYNEYESDVQHNGAAHRSIKQARRARAAGMIAQSQRVPAMSAASTGHAQQHSAQAIPGMPAFDPNDPASMMLAMQSMMQAMAQFSAMMGIQQQQQATVTQPKAQRAARCHDYDNKGFCTRGSACPYEHGEDKVVYAPYALPPDGSNTAVRGGKGKSTRKSVSQGEKQRNRKIKNQKRSEFSAYGNHTDASNTKIVVENIPEEHHSDDAIRLYFAQFGEVQTVELLPSRMAAIVEFDTHESASNAKHSRDAVFGDRFVRIFWHKIEDPDAQEEPIDPMELQQRIKEAQDAHEVKLQKLEEARAQRQELEQRMREHAQQRRKLMQALRAKEQKRKKRQRNGAPDGDDTATKSGSEVDVYDGEDEDAEDIELRNKLAVLEAEAELLGLDPDDPYSGFGRADMGYVLRGRGSSRGRGRGRGAYRGRYVARGGAMARGGVLRLDNRTRSVTISIAPGSTDDEKMRQLLLTHYEVDAIEPHPNTSDSQIVTFKERFMAEDFAIKSRKLLADDFKLSWYDVPRDSAANDLAAATAGIATANKALISVDDVMDQDKLALQKQQQTPIAQTAVGRNGGSNWTKERDLDIADDDDDDNSDDDRFMN